MSDDSISPGAFQNGHHNDEAFSPDQEIAKSKRGHDRIKVGKYSAVNKKIK